MKNITVGFLNLLLLCLLSVSSYAEHKGWRENVRIKDSVWVVDRLLQPGKYLVIYDPSTNEMSFKRDGKLIVKVVAGLIVRDDKFKHDTLVTINTDNGLYLTGIGLGGQYAEVGILEISSGGIKIERSGLASQLWQVTKTMICFAIRLAQWPQIFAHLARIRRSRDEKIYYECNRFGGLNRLVLNRSRLYFTHSSARLARRDSTAQI